MILTSKHRTLRLVVSLIVGGMLLAAIAAAPANALVRFGHGVFVGGHDFSNQTYGPRRRAVIHLSDRVPPHQGCAWHTDGQGGRVKICHLQTVHRSRP